MSTIVILTKTSVQERPHQRTTCQRYIRCTEKHIKFSLSYLLQHPADPDNILYIFSSIYMMNSKMRFPPHLNNASTLPSET